MRIGKIFGIEISVNPSWVFIFALVAYSIAQPMGPLSAVSLNTSERVVLGVIASLLFFASVLFHELAHSLLARSRGVPVRGITLFIFGGVSSLEDEPTTPPSEAWISAIGPLASLVLGGLFALLTTLSSHAPALALMFGYLAFANIALAVFNILPAYPMDGGRVLHALVWRATNDRLRATRIAATIGGAIAIVLIVGGAAETLFTGSVGGLWTTFIGWFLLNAGTLERRQSEVQSTLRNRNAADLIASPELRARADETADRVLHAMREDRVRVLPVYVADRFIGFVSIDDMAKIPLDELSRTYVTAIMTREEETEHASPSDDANDVLRRMARSGLQALPVVDAQGNLIGLVTRDSIMRWLSSHWTKDGDRVATAVRTP
ncbi:MAG: site-2 protease family protein [Candidatus Eremiobacteraeota bacterium]|nr:site-2 protease family protein [Candidatus Eremiobacteraeota bacterium]